MPANKVPWLERFDKGSAEVRAGQVALDPAQWSDNGEMVAMGAAWIDDSRYRAFHTWVMNHMIHNRAQLGRDVRTLGAAVPGTYGPSVDRVEVRYPLLARSSGLLRRSALYPVGMRSWLPKIYPILDSSVVPTSGRANFLDRLGRSLADAGVQLLEYRNKPGTDGDVLADARILRSAMPTGRVKLVMDDRVYVALAAGFDGVHVDSGDLPVAEARLLLGSERIVGTSANRETNLLQAVLSGADYVAIGPVFPTTTKRTSAIPIGIEGVRRFRAAVGPRAVLVAAAGITLEAAPAILAAGADSVAVAAALFVTADPAAEFLRWMAALESA